MSFNLNIKRINSIHCIRKISQSLEETSKNYYFYFSLETSRPGASSIYLCERGKKVWPFQV